MAPYDFLRRLLPVDILKIDRLFVSQLGHADDVIVSAITVGSLAG